MSDKNKIKPNDPLGDAFIEFMESQGVTFIDCSSSEPESNDIASGAREKLEKRLGWSIVTKKNYLRDKNKQIES